MPSAYGRYVAAVAGAVFLAAAVVGLWRAGRFGFISSAAAPDGVSVHPAAVEIAASPIPPRPEFAVPEGASDSIAEIAALRDESFDVAEELVRDLPNNPHALCLLGSVHERYGNHREAARLWQDCLRLDPRFADVHFSYGQAALKRGDFATAESHLSEAMRLDPGWTQIPLPLAKALIGQGKFQAAVGVLEPFLITNPSSFEAWCRLGQTYHALGDYRGAKRCHLEAMGLHPQSADAAYGIALAHQKLGEDDQAREYFDKFRHLRKCEQQSVRGEQPKLRDTERLSDTVAATRMTASRVALLHGLVREAEEHARRTAELDPQHLECRETLCDIYLRTQRLEEAIAVSKELRDLVPDSPRQWHRLGLLYTQQRKLDEAEPSLRRAIELAPDQAEGYVALAQVQMFPGRDRQEAVELARKAVELAPSAANHHILATACWNAGDAAGARVALQHALRLDPANPRYRHDYAQVQIPPQSP